MKLDSLCDENHFSLTVKTIKCKIIGPCSDSVPLKMYFVTFYGT